MFSLVWLKLRLIEDMEGFSKFLIFFILMEEGLRRVLGDNFMVLFIGERGIFWLLLLFGGRWEKLVLLKIFFFI